MKDWQSYEKFYAARTGGDPSVIGWDHEAFDEAREKLREETAFIENPIAIEEGAVECTRCKSLKTYSYQKQVRRADEGFSTFCSCFNCGAQWREN